MLSNPIEVGPATTVDVPPLKRIIAAAFHQYETIIPTHIYEAYVVDLQDVAGRMGSAGVLVARVDDEPVGTVTFYDTADPGWSWPSRWSVLRALAVTPTRRAGGVGRALVTACVERARASGAAALALHTASFMTSAVELYERCGFVRDPRYDLTPSAVLDVDDGDDAPQVIAYVLDLSGPSGGV